MVTFLPFKGYRPAMRPGEKIADRVSPPYDVIGPEYLRQLQNNPDNVTNLTLRPDADKRYRGSRAILDRMIAEEALKQDVPSFYLCRQTFTENGQQMSRFGIIGILKTEDYSEGNIIPHEETFSKVKEDRLNLLRDMEAHLESIFGIYEGFSDELYRRMDNAAMMIYRHVDYQGVEHCYYRLSDEPLCAEITEALKNQKMLIADGHHRYETALNYAKENPENELKQYVLATLVAKDDTGLLVLPTHRMVDAGDIGENGAIRNISKVLKLEEVPFDDVVVRMRGHDMGLVFKSGKAFIADYEGKREGLWKLDSYQAQQLVLRGVYKSDEDKSKVSYDPAEKLVIDAIRNKEHDMAVILNKDSKALLNTVWVLSMSGLRMPKKTTFFFPKMWSGFVFYLMH